MTEWMNDLNNIDDLDDLMTGSFKDNWPYGVWYILKHILSIVANGLWENMGNIFGCNSIPVCPNVHNKTNLDEMREIFLWKGCKQAICYLATLGSWHLCNMKWNKKWTVNGIILFQTEVLMCVCLFIQKWQILTKKMRESDLQRAASLLPSSYQLKAIDTS